MHNKNIILNILGKIVKYFLIASIIIGVNIYSNHINLFKKFKIEILGNQFVGNNQIYKILEPFNKESILSINLNELINTVSSLKYIEYVQASKILPNTITLHITEREPVLLVTLESDNFLMDKNGLLLPTNRDAINYFPVPIINFSESIDDALEYKKNIIEVVNFLLNDYPNFYMNLSEIIINKKEWTFYSDGKTQIFTSSKNILRQLNNLKHFEKTVFPNKFLNDYSYIDLRIIQQIVVKEKYIKG